ncbi:MAG TPA: hypothetical protein VJA66_16980, partial [Thermoanaerobaculia bacterium]
ERRPSRVWTLGIGAGFAIVALLCRLFPDPAARFAVAVTSTPTAAAGVVARCLAPALAEAGLLWIATVIAMRGLSRSGPIFLASVGVLSLVPVAANRRIARTFRQEEVLAPPAFVRYVRRGDPEGAYRVLGLQPDPSVESAGLSRDIANLEYSRRTWQHYTQALWRRGSVFNQDLDVGDLSRMESLRRLATLALRSPESAPFLASLSLRWAIRPRGQPGIAGYRRVGGDAAQDWDELPETDPDIRLLASWLEENDPMRLPGDLPRLSPGEAVLETEHSRSGAAPPGRVLVRLRSPERLVVDVSAPAATWLFVLRGFWDYRTVRVDGHPAEVVPAQIAFSAVAVPAGEHRVDWQEALPAGTISWFGPILFLIALVVVLRKTARIRPNGETG